jgi:hypothetical protein
MINLELKIHSDEPSLCGAARKTTEGSPEGGTACREASAIKGIKGMGRMSGMNLLFQDIPFCLHDCPSLRVLRAPA